MDMVGKRKELSPRFLDYRKGVSLPRGAGKDGQDRPGKGKVHFESEVNPKRLKTLSSVWLAMQARAQECAPESLF